MQDFPNHCSRSGAELLARRLDDYWHRQGAFNVRHEIYETGVKDVWAVRGNLVNGMPPK